MISEYLQKLPKKRMGSGVIFVNTKNELLLVKPTYQEGWEVPGGVVEENESPLATCHREINEELGISVKTYKLLCMDYTSVTEDRSESLQFLFFGGVLTPEQITIISLPADELSEFRFVSVEDA